MSVTAGNRQTSPYVNRQPSTVNRQPHYIIPMIRFVSTTH